MGQHRYREPSLKTTLLGFVGGTLLAAACLDAIAHFSMNIIRAHYRVEILGSRINFHDCPHLEIPTYEKAVTLNQIASTRDVFSGGRRGAAIMKNCAHEQEAFSTIDYGALCPA
jgi:hypothetical protein